MRKHGFIYSQRGAAVALALAVMAPLVAMVLVPADAAAQVVHRTTQRGVIGIMTQSVEEPGTPARQRVVMDVVPESPAARAGVMPGDTILRINGLVATSQVMNAPLEPGDTVVLRIRRDGRERDVTVVAAARSAQFETFTLRALPDSITREVLIRMETMRAHMDTLKVPSVTLERMRGDSVIMLRFGSDSARIHRFGPGFEGGVRIDSLRRFIQVDTMFRRFPLDSLRAYTFELRERARTMRDSMPHWPLPGPEAQVWFRRGDSTNVTMFGPNEIFTSGMSLGMRAVAGAELSELNPGLATYFGTEDGVLVLNSRPGTPAERAGLQAGDVILRVAQAPVSSIAELRRAIDRAPAGTPVELHVLRRGQTVRIELAR
jgi:hypothetical protein